MIFFNRKSAFAHVPDTRALQDSGSSVALVTVAAAEAARFSDMWQALEDRFVDNPQAVVAQADALVCQLMLRRGYPMGDFEQRAGDIAAAQPGIVLHYQAAHAVSVRDDASTEELRNAVIHYRALFDQLLAAGVVKERESDDRQPLPGHLAGDLPAAAAPQPNATASRSRWQAVQKGFIDDPRRAVLRGDELLAETMQRVSESFAVERRKLETELNQTENASTESMRVALRRYRSLSERLHGF